MKPEKTPNACYHCGMPMLSSQPGIRIWCGRCSVQPGGRCESCRTDVVDATLCWTVQQELDKALRRSHFQFDRCLHCGSTMHVIAVEAQDNRGSGASTVLSCWRCQAQVKVTWYIPNGEMPDSGGSSTGNAPPPIIR